MNVKRWMGVCVVVAVTAAGWGCASTAEVKRYALPVSPETTLLALDVENARGSVEVRTTSRDGAAHVTATLEATDVGRNETAAAIHADTVVDVTLEEADGRGVLRIRAGHPDATDRHRVKMLIEMPRCDGARIVNRGGVVEVVGTKGALDITNRGAGVEIRTNNPVTQDLRVLNTDGAIFVQMPPGSTGAIDLATLDGESVIRDFSGDTGVTAASREAVMTTLGEGTNSILARTNSGDVRVWVMEDPESLTRIFKVGMPDPRDYIFKQGSKRYTRNLPDDEPVRKRGTRSNPGG
jgi:hypothetical protein